MVGRAWNHGISAKRLCNSVATLIRGHPINESGNYNVKCDFQSFTFLCCFEHLLPVFKALVLTKMRTEIAILCDGLRGDGRKLIVEIVLVEVNEFDSVLNKVLGHTMELGFVLDCQNDKIRMIWQRAIIKLAGSGNSGVRALHSLLGRCEVFPHENVDVILVAVLRVWHRSSPKGQSGRKCFLMMYSS